MCPNQISVKRQRGSALVMAVFIIVVMSILAIGISKTISSSTDQTANEVLGTRALMAAESGNELVLAQLFPVTGGGGSCTASQQMYFSVAGLLSCNVQATCSNNTSGGTDYYQIVSTGVCKQALVGNNSSKQAQDLTCSADQICVSRTLEVEAKEL